MVSTANAATTQCTDLLSGRGTDVGIAAMSDGPVEIYTPGLTGNVNRTQVDPRTNAVNFSYNLGGVARSDPRAASWGPTHSMVFIRGGDDALHFMNFEYSGSAVWQSLGGIVTLNPAPVAPERGRMLVFYRGANKQLWFREYSSLTNTWTDHTSLGGVLTSSPIAVSSSPNRVTVFTRGQAGDLYVIERIDGVWGPWVGLGGSFGGDFVAVTRGPGLVDVFVRGGNARIYGISYNGSSWGSFRDLGGPPGGAVSEPGAAATSGDGLVVFAKGNETQTSTRPLYRKTSFDGGATWSDWIRITFFGSPSGNNPEAVAHAFGGWSVAATNFPTGARNGPVRLCSSTP